MASTTDRADTCSHSAERWAAEQVMRQHNNGRCQQCTDISCQMLAWAHNVLADAPASYPTLTPAGHTL